MLLKKQLYRSNFETFSHKNKRTHPKCVENFIQNPIELKSTAIKNAMDRSVISEHLVNNHVRGKSYNESIFIILRNVIITMIR